MTALDDAEAAFVAGVRTLGVPVTAPGERGAGVEPRIEVFLARAAPDVLTFAYDSRTRGVVTATAVTRAGGGDAEAKALAARIMDLFPAGSLHGGVRVDRPPHTLGARQEAAELRLPVSITWDTAI
jgi:hypothetical protein